MFHELPVLYFEVLGGGDWGTEFPVYFVYIPEETMEWLALLRLVADQEPGFAASVEAARERVRERKRRFGEANDAPQTQGFTGLNQVPGKPWTGCRKSTETDSAYFPPRA